MKSIISFILTCLCLTGVNAEPYGPISASDTLWSIASQHKPKQLSINQFIHNIFKENPLAFKNNNINQIIEGSYLDLPTALNLPKESKVSKASNVTKLSKLPIVIAKNQKPIVQHINTPIINKPNKVNPPNKPFVLAAVKPKIVSIKLKKTSETNDQVSVKKTPLKSIKKKRKRRTKVKYNYDISSSYDDNIRIAQTTSDIRDDVILQGIVKAHSTFKLNKLNKLSLGLTLQYDAHKTFSLLNQTTYGLNTRYIFALNSLYSAPLFIIKFDIGGIESNSDMRKANFIKTGFNISQRLTNKIIYTAGLQYQQNDSQSDVFDIKKSTLFFNIDFSIDRRKLIYSTYHYINGDIVSSATPNLDIINVASKIEADDAFGGADLNQFAYKIDSTSHVLTLGFNYFKSRKLSYDISAQYVSSSANDNSDISYKRLIIRAGILGRF